MKKHRDAVNMQYPAKHKLAATLQCVDKMETKGAFDIRNGSRMNLTIGSLSEKDKLWTVYRTRTKARVLLADRVSGQLSY